MQMITLLTYTRLTWRHVTDCYIITVPAWHISRGLHNLNAMIDLAFQTVCDGKRVSYVGLSNKNKWRRSILMRAANQQIRSASQLIDWVTVLSPTWHKIGHFRDILPSQSLGVVLKNLNKWNIIQHKMNPKKLKPGLFVSYDVQPGNGTGLIWKE